MPDTQVILLFGGRSNEHEISCVSAASMYKALMKAGFRVICIAVTTDNRFFLQKPVIVRNQVTESDYILIESDNSQNLISILPGEGFFHAGQLITADVIFPIIHGTYGEDGRIQSLLEFLPYPYIGSGVHSSALCFAKETAKVLWKDAGLPVVPSLIFHDSILPSLEHIISQVRENLSFPVFVKPAASGSSIGISRVTIPEKLGSALETAFGISGTVLIEREIVGRELECSVLENSMVSVPGEIIPDAPFYTFESKYTTHREATRVDVPAVIDPDVVLKCRDLAGRAFRTLRCTGFARVDMLYEESSKTVFLNEINTIPGFTPTSMFAKLLAHEGMSWEAVLEAMISSAIREHADRNRRLNSSTKYGKDISGINTYA